MQQLCSGKSLMALGRSLMLLLLSLFLLLRKGRGQEIDLMRQKSIKIKQLATKHNMVIIY